MSSPAPTAGLRDFFRKIWGDNEGYVYLPVKDNEAGKNDKGAAAPRAERNGKGR